MNISFKFPHSLTNTIFLEWFHGLWCSVTCQVQYMRNSEKRPRHILSLFSCKYNVSPIITPFPKIFVIKVVDSEVSTETQSIGVHNVHLFNTELVTHYSVIIKYGCFRLICEPRETLLPCFGPYFL